MGKCSEAEKVGKPNKNPNRSLRMPGGLRAKSLWQKETIGGVRPFPKAPGGFPLILLPPKSLETTLLASLCFLKLALGVLLPAQHFSLFFLEGFDEFLALFLLFLRLFFLLVPQLFFQGLAAFATFGGVFLFPKAPTLGVDVRRVGNKH